MTKNNSSSRLTITIENEPKPDEVEIVRNGLRDFNLLHAPELNYRSLELMLRGADDKVLGGLLGETYWGWLHIAILWVDASLRGQGYGRELLRTAEQEAVRRGCRAAHLDTMSFQAQPFYEKEGYTVFGILNDLPQGNQRIFLYKKLD